MIRAVNTLDVGDPLSLFMVLVSRDHQASLPVDSPQKSALVALLTGAGQPAECLCSLFIKQEKQRVQEESETAAGSSGKVNKEDAESIVPWAAMRLQVTDTLGVMCAFSKEAVKSVVTSGAVPFLLGVLRCVLTWGL